jgi:hypothetical protein
MRRTVIARVIFSALNLIACISLIIIHSLADWNRAAGFTWGLPILAAAIFALIAGIFTFRKRNWGWAISGLIIAGVAWIYYGILMLIHSWTMQQVL